MTFENPTDEQMLYFHTMAVTRTSDVLSGPAQAWLRIMLLHESPSLEIRETLTSEAIRRFGIPKKIKEQHITYEQLALGEQDEVFRALVGKHVAERYFSGAAELFHLGIEASRHPLDSSERNTLNLEITKKRELLGTFRSLVVTEPSELKRKYRIPHDRNNYELPRMVLTYQEVDWLIGLKAAAEQNLQTHDDPLEPYAIYPDGENAYHAFRFGNAEIVLHLQSEPIFSAHIDDEKQMAIYEVQFSYALLRPFASE